MIRYRCSCGADFCLSDDLAGRKIRCTQCGAKGRVPSETTDSGGLAVPTEEELEQIDLDDSTEPKP